LLPWNPPAKPQRAAAEFFPAQPQGKNLAKQIHARELRSRPKNKLTDEPSLFAADGVVLPSKTILHRNINRLLRREDT